MNAYEDPESAWARGLGPFTRHFFFGVGAFHVQAQVTHPTRGRLEVDVALAVLLVDLWRLGIDTDFSCQGDDEETVEADYNSAYISFPDAHSACEMRRLLNDSEPHLAGWQPDNYDNGRHALRFSPSAIPGLARAASAEVDRAANC